MVPVRRAAVDTPQRRALLPRTFRTLATLGALAMVSLTVLPSPVTAQEVEGAGAYYWDDLVKAKIVSVRVADQTRRLLRGAGQATAARLGATVKLIDFKNPPDLLSRQLDGRSSIQETSLSAGIDQGVAVGTQVGLMLGSTQSALSRVRYVGVRAGQWWLKETLQTSLELRKTSVSQPPLDYTDTDGQRIVTPADLDGLNAALTVTQLTTPTTISRGTYSRTTRSDRPAAWAVGGEVRQYLRWTTSAVHVGLTHYENVGHITAETSYGSVVANSAKAEWHQRLPQRMILMGGYRYYVESEKPRADDLGLRQIGTDSLYASLRWRLGSASWTADAPELYGFAARYTSNVPNTAYLLGVGARLLF